MIEIEFADGSWARVGGLTDDQLEAIYMHIEANFRPFDTIGG